MTLDEYNKLYADVGINILLELKNSEDRTLLYGYTTERNSFHVYAENGEVAVYIYKNGKDKPIFYFKNSKHVLPSLVPNKRVYPETCDTDFCHLLISSGVHISFTTFDENREQVKYYGEVYKEPD